MNRFFSKLDLRDIKIDPTGTRFPPDAEEYEAELDEEPVQTSDNGQEPATAVAEPTRQPHVPAWAPEPAPATSYLEDELTFHQQAATEGIEQPAAGDSVASDGEPAGESRSGEVLKVSARSRPSAVAGAIAGVVRESGRAEVQAIGAGATNQAVKAVAIARDYLRETGIEAVCLPAFIDVTIDNEDRTAIRLVVEPR
jgi:stage V sporulation protein S